MPRESDRWKATYRKRAAVEREFGRLKHEWGLARCGSVASTGSGSMPTSPS